MSETPRTGDRVRVTFETTVASGAPNPETVWVETPGQTKLGVAHITPLPVSTVEVLERADDPGKDEIGTVRREQHADDATGESYSVWQHTQYQLSETVARSHWLCTHSTHHGNLGEALTHDQVRGMPVIGAAPGTPAAAAKEHWRHCDTCECIHPPCGYVIGSQGCDSVCDREPPARMSVRVPNEPHGPSANARHTVAACLVVGDLAGAVRALRRATGMGMGESDAYLRDMPEYQVYLSKRDEKAQRFRYFTRTNHYLHRITPSGEVQYRNAVGGWVTVSPGTAVTVAVLESQWDEVDVEPIGGAS